MSNPRYQRKLAAVATIEKDKVSGFFSITWWRDTAEQSGRHYDSLRDAATMAHSCGASALEYNGVEFKL